MSYVGLHDLSLGCEVVVFVGIIAWGGDGGGATWIGAGGLLSFLDLG